MIPGQIKKLMAFFLLLSLSASIAGCSSTVETVPQKQTPVSTAKGVSPDNNSSQKDEKAQTLTSPESFLKLHNLSVIDNPEKFAVKIPDSWEVKAEKYPEGLYWRLVNEFSRDAGLDLTPFKGASADVWRYELIGGLPGQGDQSNFSYPSNAVLLVKDQKVVGAWLAFNRWGIGPSVKKRYLEDITGLTYEEWVDKENLFVLNQKNKELSALGPVEVLKEFLEAVDKGDKERAYSCLSPKEMLSALTVNLEEKRLYNSGFGRNNSMVENIIKAKPVAFKLMDTKSFEEIKQVTGQKEVEIAVTLELKWRDSQFNNPEGKDIRFSIMRKYRNGWKVGGLGTGP